MKIKRIFHRYEKWEDFQNGMYDYISDTNDDLLIKKAEDLLRNVGDFERIMKLILIHWPVSSQVNLTNVSCNRRSWLGQASCSYLHKVPEILTRIAWGNLSSEEQNRANEAAEKIIIQFESSLL